MSKKWLLMIIVLVVAIMTTAGCGKKQEDQSAGDRSNQTEPQTNAKQWNSPPKMQIDPAKKYSAEVTTSKGKFTIELFAKDAPKTVNNFVFLAKEGYYNDVLFHRIIESFMIQTGDPTGTGTGGPGYKFEDELPPAIKYEPGVVAMANAGPNTNGSQFFICSGEDSGPILNPQPYYTVFGKVTDGMETVQAIAKTPVQVNPNGGDSSPSMPTEKITIDSIKIVEQ